MIRWTLILLSFCFCVVEAKEFKIYHDADYSIHTAAADAMYMGLSVAIDELKQQFPEHSFNVVKKNHRGNSKRSLLTMQAFLNDPDALLVWGGLHSPPYIKHRDFINQNHIPLMVPWAAAGPITRYPSGDNWVFRLSIDDTKAGFRIVNYAVEQRACKKPHLLLENTAWGKSNYSTMSQAVKQYLDVEPEVTWFNWGLKANAARILLRDIANLSVDCVLYVGNSTEGKVIFETWSDIETLKNVPLLSHWGITGGDFSQTVYLNRKQDVDLSFIQTCFSFFNDSSDFSRSILARAHALFPKTLDDPITMSAPAGFFHSYDLAKIVFSALAHVDLNLPLLRIRQQLKVELESLRVPVHGLIKQYKQPFSVWSETNDSAHEALGLADFCMARFDDDGYIRLLHN